MTKDILYITLPLWVVILLHGEVTKKMWLYIGSRTEVEFKGMALGPFEVLWLRLLLQDLVHISRQTIWLYCDNKTARDITHNLIQYGSTKHIEIEKFFIKEKLDEKIVQFLKI